MGYIVDPFALKTFPGKIKYIRAFQKAESCFLCVRPEA